MKAKGSGRREILKRRDTLEAVFKAWSKNVQAPTMHRNSLKWQEERRRLKSSLELAAGDLARLMMEEYPEESTHYLLALASTLTNEPRYTLTDKGHKWVKGRKHD